MVWTDSIIDAGRATTRFGRASNECFEIDRDLGDETSNAARVGESAMNRTVISCQEAYVSGTADNIAGTGTPGDTGLQWILNTGATPYAFNTFNQVITDPANPLVQVLQPGTFFSVDLNGTAAGTALNTVTMTNAAGATITIGSDVEPVGDGYIGAVRSNANWTAPWTFGLNAGNRSIAPWWE
jgi:hypothetical protein